MKEPSAGAARGRGMRDEPARRRKEPALLGKGLLVLLSIAVGVVAGEVALRLFHPRYAFAAQSPPREARAGWPTYRRSSDPDTGKEHYVIRNNLDGRQSRNFGAANLDGAVNIGFFGDSQTENFLMPAQYSYTEPLDYLLNLGPLPRPGGQDARFNVLNFGVRGTGTGRAYLRWRGLPVRRELAHVFYMVSSNDLGDLGKAIRAGIVRLGESGDVLAGGPQPTPPWKRLLARLHLTYLAIDAWHRVAADESGGARVAASAEVSRAEVRSVFRDLVRRWKREVEADGAAFHVVVVPDPFDGGDFADETELRAELGLLTMLDDCLQAAAPGSGPRNWRFARDPHWNPAANMVAATCLYRYLEDVIGLPQRTDEALAQARYAYYRAFLDSAAWEGERYMPDAPDAEFVAGAGMWRPAAESEAVVAKYLALELTPLDDRWRRAVRAARAAGALGTSAWNVYANVEERLLVFEKIPCPVNWQAVGTFFLHVVPFTLEKLPADRARFGFVNLDGVNSNSGPFSPLRRIEGDCVFTVPLPGYPLSKVRTGRFTTLGEDADVVYDNLWSVEFSMPLARSVWTVYASAGGRGLDYVKTPCRRADTETRFFLHVYPLRPADLPATAPGYANLDFAWEGKGALADGDCRVSAALPDFPIAFVRTGQYRGGIVPRRLWNARIDFAEVERARRATAP